jgi:hypothetical protein
LLQARLLVLLRRLQLVTVANLLLQLQLRSLCQSVVAVPPLTLRKSLLSQLLQLPPLTSRHPVHRQYQPLGQGRCQSARE